MASWTPRKSTEGSGTNLVRVERRSPQEVVTMPELPEEEREPSFDERLTDRAVEALWRADDANMLALANALRLLKPLAKPVAS